MANEMITVIIPVYKVEEYLRRCVDSVLNQTYTNLEVILVDDGSPDGCPAICDEYAQRDSRVHVIHKENGGVSTARNAGMDYVFAQRTEVSRGGGYIGFIDSDDWVHPQYFEVLVNAAVNYNADIVVCNMARIYGDDTYEMHFSDVDKICVRQLSISEVLRGGNERKYAWGKLYKKSLLENRRFTTQLPVEDTPFNVDLLCENMDIRFFSADAKLYYYVQRGDSLVHTMSQLECIVMPEYYISAAKNDWSMIANQIRLQESIKWYLSIRYVASVGNVREVYKKCHQGVQWCVRRITNSGVISTKQRIAYTLFAYFPFTYRLFRIVDDPTMLNWERSQKRLRKEEKS